jgi:hypothetical protein
MKGLKKVVSIVPFNHVSHCLISAFKHQNIKTYALRTQTVNHTLCHLSCNADMLFYRTEREKQIYESLRPLLLSNLCPGGLYNLPPQTYDTDKTVQDLKPYVLVLGTTPANHETFDAWRDQIRQILQFAKLFGMQIVYKSHNLALEWDTKILQQEFPDTPHLTEIRNNRELIDSADLILTFPSTLLYYVLHIQKPFLILTNPTHMHHEFSGMPCIQVNLHIDIPSIGMNDVLRQSVEASTWFESIFKPTENEFQLMNELVNA